MTTETRHFTGLSDLLAIEFCCNGCGARTSRTFKKFQKLPYQCGGCGEPMFSGRNREANALESLAEAIAVLALSEKDLSFSIRLEVSGDAPGARRSASQTSAQAQ